MVPTAPWVGLGWAGLCCVARIHVCSLGSFPCVSLCSLRFSAFPLQLFLSIPWHPLHIGMDMHMKVHPAISDYARCSLVAELAGGGMQHQMQPASQVQQLCSSPSTCIANFSPVWHMCALYLMPLHGMGCPSACSVAMRRCLRSCGVSCVHAWSWARPTPSSRSTTRCVWCT